MSSAERRLTRDRRREDRGPPGGAEERRCRAERRLPSVVESSMSESEWKAYFGWLRLQRQAVPLRQSPANIPACLWGDV